MSDKTYSELTQATDIQAADLLATFRPTAGPLKAAPWSLLVSTLQAALAGLFLTKSQNLADLPSVSQARSSLGLGTAAIANVGQATGNVAAGDDSRFTTLANAAAAAQATANAALPSADITYGTAAPGTLANGVIYFQYTA